MTGVGLNIAIVTLSWSNGGIPRDVHYDFVSFPCHGKSYVNEENDLHLRVQNIKRIHETCVCTSRISYIRDS